MSDVKTFLLPDVGEGLTEAEILVWHVKPGDTVVVNQTVVEIETAKAAVELPCPYAGTVTEVLVNTGDVVLVGTPILSIALAGTTASPQAEPPHEGAPEGLRGPQTSPTTAGVSPDAGPAVGERTPVLVGYGVKQTGVPTRRARVVAHDPHGTTAPEAGPPGELVKPVRHGGLEIGRHTEEVLSRRSPVLAKPPVRRLAKELDVDLAGVDATGADGVITRADVERAALVASSVSVGKDKGLLGPLGHLHAVPGRRGAEERETRRPVKGVTRLMAEAMVTSAFTAPHVTEWVEVDVTRTLDLVERLRQRRELADIRVSPLLVVAMALIHATQEFPGINASWDEASHEIVDKHYVNLGIAAATPRGLVVPHVKDADTLDLVGLARALHELVETAKAGRTTPEAMTGGTITITNVGVFGVDGGTPIINPGEAAILCMGRALERPWVVDGEVRVRTVMQLTLSFDHRMIDGALGSKALASIARFLEDPAVALLLG